MIDYKSSAALATVGDLSQARY